MRSRPRRPGVTRSDDRRSARGGRSEVGLWQLLHDAWRVDDRRPSLARLRRSAAAGPRGCRDQRHVLGATVRPRPGVVGRSVRLKGVAFVIVGVARRGFASETPGESVDLWMPLSAQPNTPCMGVERAQHDVAERSRTSAAECRVSRRRARGWSRCTNAFATMWRRGRTARSSGAACSRAVWGCRRQAVASRGYATTSRRR